MLYLILSICCSLAVASIFKYNETRQWNRVALLTASYVAATLMAAAVLLLMPPGTIEAAVTFDRGLVLLVLITGSLFISTYFILAWATNVAGMGLATGVMRVSVVVPVPASWLIWAEAPSPAQGVGLLLATAAFFVLQRVTLRKARLGSPSVIGCRRTAGYFSCCCCCLPAAVS